MSTTVTILGNDYQIDHVYTSVSGRGGARRLTGWTPAVHGDAGEIPGIVRWRPAKGGADRECSEQDWVAWNGDRPR